ncbi:hypothetical protein N9L19_01490 [bacterium]|nr:hypothetical protein [bacterium]
MAAELKLETSWAADRAQRLSALLHHWLNAIDSKKGVVHRYMLSLFNASQQTQGTGEPPAAVHPRTEPPGQHTVIVGDDDHVEDEEEAYEKHGGEEEQSDPLAESRDTGDAPARRIARSDSNLPEGFENLCKGVLPDSSRGRPQDQQGDSAA